MYLLLRIVPIQGRKFTLWNYCYSNCARARFVIIFLPSVIAISINAVPCTCGKVYNVIMYTLPQVQGTMLTSVRPRDTSKLG